MKQNITLTFLSLLSMLLLMFHFTHDVIRQAEGVNKYPIPVVVFALWLYATLMLSGRISGYVIMFLGGLFSAGMIIVHSRGVVIGKAGGFFFVWTLLALSATGWVTMILCVRGVWMIFRSRRSRLTASPSEA